MAASASPAALTTKLDLSLSFYSTTLTSERAVPEYSRRRPLAKFAVQKSASPTTWREAGMAWHVGGCKQGRARGFVYMLLLHKGQAVQTFSHIIQYSEAALAHCTCTLH